MNLVGDVLKASTSPVLVLLADSSVDLFCRKEGGSKARVHRGTGYEYEIHVYLNLGIRKERDDGVISADLSFQIWYDKPRLWADEAEKQWVLFFPGSVRTQSPVVSGSINLQDLCRIQSAICSQDIYSFYSLQVLCNINILCRIQGYKLKCDKYCNSEISW